jgi:hypothetical protein
MKWRARLAVLLGFLLAVPLMWASNRLLLGGLSTSETREDGSRIVPILPPDETRRLLTFERPCRGDEDCDAPLVCLRGKLMWKAACVASQCSTDVDCSEGLSCYSIRAGERVVRRCGAPGKAKAGEFCVELPLKPEMGCAPGLMCTDKRCRRSCQPQEPQGCPAGYFCSAADVKGTVCLPTCEGQSCPEGQRCVALKHGASVCARVHGPDCQLNPCPAGQECEVTARESRNDVGMRCLLACDPQSRPCPEGFSCMRGQCIQQCNSDAPGTCGPMEKCAGWGMDTPGWCMLDLDE